MSELRQDPFSDRWVVIAPNRGDRPQEFTQSEQRRRDEACPFCAGNEKYTPEAVAVYGATSCTDPLDWQVRVVPNKFPAVGIAASEDEVQAREFTSLYQSGAGQLGQIQPGIGVHEVIVESPTHLVSFSELPIGQAEFSFLAYRDRLLALRSHPQLRYGLVFKNARGAAGASLSHVHSQLIGLPLIPPQVQYELTKAHEHVALRGATLMTSVLDAEIADGRRIVAMTDRFVCFCPAASRFPYETWVVPRAPLPRFELESPEVVFEAGRIVRQVINRLESVVVRTAYNYWLHTAPLGDDSGGIHWRIEIAPRLSHLAGFEIGTGCFINSIAPEEAATHLR